MQFLTATKDKPEIPVLMLGGYELLYANGTRLLVKLGNARCLYFVGAL